MDSRLTADLKALRELASHEYDPAKLLALTETICELMGQQSETNQSQRRTQKPQ
jgi:hypothetical protein